MSRYAALRAIGCDPFAAGVIAFMNWVAGQPSNEIRFMHIIMEIEPDQDASISSSGERGGER